MDSLPVLASRNLSESRGFYVQVYEPVVRMDYEVVVLVTGSLLNDSVGSYAVLVEVKVFIWTFSLECTRFAKPKLCS